MSENENEAALRRYLAHMDSGDYSSAIEIFASDAVYIRPLIGAGASTPVLAELVGREAIAQSWEQRGRRNIVHDVEVLVTDGDDTFAEGVATVDGERALLFVTHATFDGSGQVRRLVAQSAPLRVLGRSTPAQPLLAENHAEGGHNASWGTYARLEVPSYQKLLERTDGPPGLTR
jgi:ketosteroid isomerase-like protein